MNIRLPDPPVLWEMGWGSSLISTLQSAFASLAGPRPLQRYTAATLPQAKPYDGVMVYITDGTDNRHVVISDGQGWAYLDGEALP